MNSSASSSMSSGAGCLVARFGRLIVFERLGAARLAAFLPRTGDFFAEALRRVDELRDAEAMLPYIGSGEGGLDAFRADRLDQTAVRHEAGEMGCWGDIEGRVARSDTGCGDALATE